MANVLPTIIPGPAIIQHNGASFYAKDDIKLDYQPEHFEIATNMAGVIDRRKKSDKFVLSWTPDGQIEGLVKYYPHLPAGIGKSIFPAGNLANVVIWTLEGHKHTFFRGAVTKCPQMRLKPDDTLFGDMQITCIGAAATQRTDAAYYKSLAAAALVDTTFDETVTRTDSYNAAWGAAPYDVMGSMGGFEIDIDVKVSEIRAVDFGVAEITLDSLEARARFIPSSLTEAQLDGLINFQDAAAIGIGQSFAKAGNDLVITSAFLSATIHKAGPAGFAQMFARGKHRHDAVEFFSKRTWTAGAPNPLWDFTLL